MNLNTTHLNCYSNLKKIKVNKKRISHKIDCKTKKVIPQKSSAYRLVVFVI